MHKLDTKRCTDATSIDAVHGTPPREFRIWKSGTNETDHGAVLFSDRSAQALMADQAKRGNLYSIDVDHLSLSPSAPPEARKAVGWHRLEVRDGDLWAVDVQWTQMAATALASAVPEYRYFSPAYDVDTETSEIVGYVNTALTNNPATWNVTALATARPVASCKCGANLVKEARIMPKYLDDVRAAVAAMAAEGDEEEMKMAARFMAAFGEAEEKPAPEAEEKPAPDAPAADAAPALDARLAANFEAQSKRIAKLESQLVSRERDALFAARPDVSAELKAELANEAPEKIKRVLSAIKPPVATPTAELAAASTATRGADGAGPSNKRVLAGSPEMRARMGLLETTSAVVHDGPVLRLGVTIPKESV